MCAVCSHSLLRFKIYVIEQVGNDIFNKARLFNAGFDLAAKEGLKWDCYGMVENVSGLNGMHKKRVKNLKVRIFRNLLAIFVSPISCKF